MTSVETYNYKVVRQFSIMTIIWGLVGMSVGVLIASQLAWPVMNFDIPWLTFGRLRPLHTNAVIFAFGGCSLFACSYYVVQHTCHVKLAFPALAAFTFWGWQAVIVLAAITLPMGITSSKEYAELEWPIDILITLVWVSYAIVFFGTIMRRRVSHIYVANWFFGAFIITVAVLHIFNSAAIPVSLWKSYSAYAGVQDAGRKGLHQRSSGIRSVVRHLMQKYFTEGEVLGEPAGVGVRIPNWVESVAAKSSCKVAATSRLAQHCRHQSCPLEDQELDQTRGEEARGRCWSQAHRTRVPQGRDFVAQDRGKRRTQKCPDVAWPVQG